MTRVDLVVAALLLALPAAAQSPAAPTLFDRVGELERRVQALESLIQGQAKLAPGQAPAASPQATAVAPSAGAPAPTPAASGQAGQASPAAKPSKPGLTLSIGPMPAAGFGSPLNVVHSAVVTGPVTFDLHQSIAPGTRTMAYVLEGYLVVGEGGRHTIAVELTARQSSQNPEEARASNCRAKLFFGVQSAELGTVNVGAKENSFFAPRGGILVQRYAVEEVADTQSFGVELPEAGEYKIKLIAGCGGRSTTGEVQGNGRLRLLHRPPSGGALAPASTVTEPTK